MRSCRYLVFIVFIFMMSCAAPQKRVEKYPKIYDEKPLSILVLPPINKTTAADAKEFYLTTIAEPLSYAGYYMLPLPLSNYVLKSEGLFDAENIKDNHIKKFKELFGVDAVLFITLTDWTTSYLVFSGSVTVSVELDLKSSSTYNSLWNYKGTMKVDTSENNSGNFIANLVLTAVKTAMTDYVPVAKRINYAIIEQTLPYGKYHPLHNQDQLYLVPDKVEIVAK